MATLPIDKAGSSQWSPWRLRIARGRPWRLPQVLAILMAPLLSGQSLPPASPMVQVNSIERISPAVEIIADNDVPGVPNIGIIAGSRAILVVDTGLGARNGGAVNAIVAERADGRRVYLVTTHAHPEHDLGANGFPAAVTMIRSFDQIRDIEENGLSVADMFSSRSSEMADLLQGASFRAADIAFDEELVLDLGGVQARLVALGANHTLGDTAIFVVQDRVLFSGDVAMQQMPILTSSHSTIANFLAALDRLEALGPSTIVPSHGPIGDAAYIAAYRDFLREVYERTASLKTSGMDLEETTETVAAQMESRYPASARVASAVRAAFAEAPATQ